MNHVKLHIFSQICAFEINVSLHTLSNMFVFFWKYTPSNGIILGILLPLFFHLLSILLNETLVFHFDSERCIRYSSLFFQLKEHMKKKHFICFLILFYHYLINGLGHIIAGEGAIMYPYVLFGLLLHKSNNIQFRIKFILLKICNKTLQICLYISICELTPFVSPHKVVEMCSNIMKNVMVKGCWYLFTFR